MKKVRLLFLMAVTGFLASSCQSDEGQDLSVVGGEGMTAVQFDLDASAIQHEVITSTRSTRAYSPTYEKGNFSIYAFKQNEDSTDFVYEKTINLSNMSYSTSTKKLTGTDLVPIGVYKFVAVYGIVNQSGLLTAPSWGSSTSLTDNLGITYNGSGALSEIFMQTDADVSTLPKYAMGLTEGSNPTVNATIRRAVSRVDVMFIKASKSAEGVYTEQPYKTGADALGGKGLKSLKLEMTNLNNSMNLFGVVPTGSTFNKTISLNSPNSSVVYGNATATQVGASNYLSYNDIQPSHIIKGGAHITGCYFIPNMDNSKNTALKMEVESLDGIVRTINVSTDTDKYLPLERNKVTIVKIYILDDDDDDDDDEDPDVFNTKVTFEVKIETAWQNSNEVIGEIE